MLKELKKTLAHKKILILGFGIEGASTYRFLRRVFPTIKIGVSDQNKNHSVLLNISKTDENIDLHIGKEYLKSISNYDFVFKSPGIKTSLLPRSKNVEISCQTDLFLSSFKEQIIGITGTKGKSTTSSLIYHLLNSAGKSSVLIGNIGLPPFEVIDQIKKDTVIVYELSSHMLETVSHSPHLSIFLNLFPEHLDHYKNFAAYQMAKANIYKYQSKVDFLICPDNFEFKQDSISSNLLQFGLKKTSKTASYLNKHQIGAFDDFVIDISDLNLIGEHNQLNIMAAILACQEIGLTKKELSSGLKSFYGLEHRLEYVGLFKDIHYYNDSIATIPEAVIEAIKSVPDVDTIILGGYDRGINYDFFVEFILNSNVQNIVFLGEVGKKLYKKMQGAKKQMLYAENLESCFDFIRKYTSKGKSCLLSPAASSYDQFKNFEERGRVYKKLARN